MAEHDWYERLEAQEKQLLLYAALIPPLVSLDDLMAVTGQSAVQVLGLLEHLVEERVLSTEPSRGRGLYHFSGPELVGFVLDQVPKKELKAAAQRLLSFFETCLEEGLPKSLTLTHLSQISGLKPKRLADVLTAAQYCLAQNFKDYAARYFRLALDSLARRRRTKAQKESYIDAVLGLLAAYGHLIPLSEQEDYLRRAQTSAKQLQDQDRLAQVDLVYAQVCKTEGKYKKAAQLFDEGWDMARRLGQEDLLKKAALMTTDFLFWQGRVAAAVERYEQVIGNLEEFPSDEATLRACAALGWCYGICGQTARGIGLIEAVRVRAKELGLREVKVYADLMTVLALLEARRIPEAETYLNQILSLPEEVLGHYILWASNAAMAFVLFNRDDLTGCFRLQKRAYDQAQKLGRSHHRGPWNLDYLDGLEEAGLVHPQMNYESEIKRMLTWPDIYMQGVALRYKAQRARKRGRPRKEIRRDLQASQRLLTRAGARLELARTQILLARLLLEEGKEKKAGSLLQEAWQVVSAVNESIFPEDLKQYIAEEDREELLVQTIRQVGNTLGTVRNRKKLLERIINLTMRLTRAERGGFFLAKERGGLELAASRNLDRAMVGAQRFRENLATIEEVASTGRGVIRGAGSAQRDGGSGAEGSGWMICDPVRLQDRLLGVFYLEGRLTRRFFPEKDLPLLKAIGNQVAIALDNVRAYEEIAELRDRLQEETRFYRMDSELSPELGQIVGDSPAIRLVKKQMQKVAPTDSTVLVTGETGVGKELVARGIHRLSPRAEGPFIPVNIASLSEGLIASELFGHERGAFTGAVRARPGRFELAHGGTLFLDDVENLSEEMQIKLLRVLQEKEFERVGGSRTIKSDFCLTAAANQSLEEMVEQGRFRSDLYYRLNVFPIYIPPLRERREDIPRLAMHFLEMYKKKLGKNIQGISNQEVKRLRDYPWPGNVRELKHVIERAVILSEGESLSVPSLKDYTPLEARRGRWLSLEEMERSYIIEALEKCGWRVSGPQGAARLLDLKPPTLYSKMKRLGIRRKVTYAVG